MPETGKAFSSYLSPSHRHIMNLSIRFALVSGALFGIACGSGSGSAQPGGTGGTLNDGSGGSVHANGTATGGTESDGGTGTGGGTNGDSGGTGGMNGTGGTGPISNDPDPDTDTPYETALRSLVRFYGAQRVGDADNWLLKRIDPESPSCFVESPHGGWFDAGDHINSTLSTAYSAMLLLLAYDAFPTAFDDLYGPTDPLGDDGEVRGTPNGIPDILDEVRYGTEYLADIGTGNDMVLDMGSRGTAHTVFHTCTTQQGLSTAEGGSPRPITRGNGGAAAGMAAASLALMARHYRAFDEQAASRYEAAAIALYADADPDGVVGGPGVLYAGSKPRVGMLCGAAELYRLTGEASYLADAEQFSADVDDHNWIAGWDNPHEFCWHSLYAASGNAGALSRWTDNLLRTTSNTGEASGMIYRTGNDWGTLRHATTAAFSLALHSLTDSPTGEADRELALSQLAFAMGDGASPRSWIVGYGPNFPRHPHHRNAHGWDEADLTRDTNLHLLHGALVGGPTPTGTYLDHPNDYVMNEVAIDYNAGVVGLAAFAVHLERH